jgi:hypothetical protein
VGIFLGFFHPFLLDCPKLTLDPNLLTIIVSAQIFHFLKTAKNLPFFLQNCQYIFCLYSFHNLGTAESKRHRIAEETDVTTKNVPTRLRYVYVKVGCASCEKKNGKRSHDGKFKI